MSGCYVEIFRADLSPRWGYQCFTCPYEHGGFLTFGEAAAAGEHHRVEVATEQMIELGELP